MSETLDLEDLRLFAAVARVRGFSAAGRTLGVPKQTLSRRIAALEEQLGVQLLQRTTRSVRLTDAGAAFAAECEDIVRRADDATRALTDAQDAPRGKLRISADPVFGESFVSPIVVDYAGRYPDVAVEVELSRRRVDLLAEGFDLAFRVTDEEQVGLTSSALMPAEVRFCASPDYLCEFGRPSKPEDLADHTCILVGAHGGSQRWPFRRGRSVKPVTVKGRLRFSSLRMAREAALGGLGIGLFPAFFCEEDMASRALVPVLD